jgi:peptidoglycan/xylan/chitin deacetylase (PgdA/CDA1 family)
VIITLIIGAFSAVDLASTSQQPVIEKVPVSETVYLTANANNNLTVYLSWTPVKEAQYYVVKRGLFPERLYPIPQLIKGTSYFDRSLDPTLSDHYYSVIPVVNGKESEASPVIMLPKVNLLFNQNQRIPVLMYHEVVPEGQKIDVPGLVVSREEFREQMIFLKKQGYTAMFLRDLNSYLANKKPLPDKTIVVTFDDGYRSFYNLVYPILEELNIKVSVAVIPKSMNDNFAYYYISWNKAREMVKGGLVEVVSHSNSHKKLNSISTALLSEEITVSDKTIAKHLGRKSNILVYPLGGYNDKVIQSVKEQYVLGISMKDGVNKYGTDPFIIRRCRVSHGDKGEEIEKHFRNHK